MPFLPEHPRFKGITLPPSGWVLAVLLAVYIFTGLIGHDPWKHDDAVSIGIAFDIFSNGNWLTPQLAGQPHPDAPFYYWSAAITAHLFSWLLPFHDAARLASGLYTLLALEFTLLAARELHGRDHAAAAPLILAGSIGFLFHAHEAQPMLAALTAHTATYWGLALLPRRPRLATVIFGSAIGLGFLANGVLPVLTLLPVALCSLWHSENRIKDGAILFAGALIAILVSAAWLLPLQATAPDLLADFLRGEMEPFVRTPLPASNILRHLNLLLWYAWPALPLAAWALWSKRRTLATRPIAIPALSFLSVLAILGLSIELRSASALLLLPPLVLLAVPGFSTLRRGAANAFDWFGMMTFTIFAAIVWVAWSAMVFGWPARLARQAVRLEPGFVGQFNLFFCLASILATGIWFWLIATSPRSPMRGIMHWMAGLTLFWLLIVALWMPWIDYGKTYRPLAASLAGALPAKAGCIANANLPDSILATLDYFNGIRTIPLTETEAKRCNLMLVLGTVRNADAIYAAGWRKVWEDKRPSDRRSNDTFKLFKRELRTKKSDAVPELIVEESGATVRP
jgi:4-amino-4-deoxy-L-arabinose transferase-like glycosyltransferase